MNSKVISVEIVDGKANVVANVDTPDEMAAMCSLLLCGLAQTVKDPLGWLMQITGSAAAHIGNFEEERENEAEG